MTIGYDPFNWYWIVGDSSPSSQVYSSATNGFVSNSDATFLSWLVGAEGSGTDILSAADNGTGKIRLTVGTTSDRVSNQYWYVKDDAGVQSGVFQITVIDATHVDLVGSTFTTSFTGRLNGATLIATAALLAQVINNVAVTTFKEDAYTVSNFSADIELTNPPATDYDVLLLGAGLKVVLPPMNSPRSLPVGKEFKFRNIGFFSFGIVYNDGTVIPELTTVRAGQEVIITSRSNTTKNGTLAARIASPTGKWGFEGTTGSTSGATVTFVWKEGVVRKPSGQTLFIPSGTATVDLTVVGTNGRDTLSAFSANQQVHFYVISKVDGTTAGIASLSGPNINGGPTLPASYEYFGWMVSLWWDGSALESFQWAEGSLRTNQATILLQGQRGWTRGDGTAGSLLIGQGVGLDPALTTIGGDAAVSSAGTFTISSVTATATNDDATSGKVGYYKRSGGSKSGTETDTVTISNASPGIVTLASHGLDIGTCVYLTTTGALPTGLTASTNYYVSSQSFAAGSFALSTSLANAIAGTSINTSSAGSGTHTLHRRAILTTATPLDIAGLSLPAGDWDVWGTAAFQPLTSTVNATQLVASISNTTGTVDVHESKSAGVPCPQAGLVGGTGWNAQVGATRLSLSSLTTVFFVVSPVFTVAGLEVYGAIHARRRR